MVSVPAKLVNIFSETSAPSSRFGGNTENINTRNPAITTIALKMIAFPECAIVSCATFNLSSDFAALMRYCSKKCTA